MVYPVHEESPRVLVVDDEKVIREILSDFLMMEGYVVRTVPDGEEAIKELERRSYNMVISDLKMPNMGGLELLERIAQANLDVLTVIMTGFGTVETAIEAMKKGAYDYVLKPFKVEEVVHIVQRGLDRQRLAQENFRLQEALSLYKISEAMTSSLSLDTILDVITQATLEEIEADVISLILQNPKTGAYEERLRKMARELDTIPGYGVPNLEEMMLHYQRGEPLLVHGIRAHRYLNDLPSDKRLVSFCSVPFQLKGQVIGMINAYSFTRGKKFSEGQRKMLAVLGSRAVVSIENARLYENLVATNEELITANRSLEENYRQTILGFAHALEESDRYTRGHSDRVAVYARLIAEGLTMSEKEVELVVWSGLMHDIGKLGIRYEKLNKPGKLTPEETAMFRTHPAKGKRILEPIPSMRNLTPGCYCHHEAWDGSGYPQGLCAHNIPIIGRIVALADAYDAMTSDRAYRKALPHHVAVAELERCTAIQFDPELVPVFLKRLEIYRKQALEAGEPVPR